MCVDVLRSFGVGLLLLLSLVLLMSSCASQTPPLGSGRSLGSLPRANAEPASVQQTPSGLELKQQQQQGRHRRKAPAERMTKGRPDSSAKSHRQYAELTREAVLGAVSEASSSMGRIGSALYLLENKPEGLGKRANSVFTRYIRYTSGQLPWLQGALSDVILLTRVSSKVHDPDMELALLRLAGPQLQAAISGTTLLAAWLDFLHLAEVVLQQSPTYGVERLFMDMDRIQKRIEPSMRSLASLEPGQVEAVAAVMPELMAQLTQEFQSIRETARLAVKRTGQAMMVAQLIEMIALGSAMKRFLPRLPPTAPALASTRLVMGAGGVMMGSQIIVTADWMEMMRRLVQAGVLSMSAASAAVRIQAGQVMMAQANPELPPGVRDALGDGPEVRAMHETGKTGAGMAERPRHHVLPEEYREWFEKRGFKGAMSIDQFCVELEVAKHQALHGGGSWRLGRTWPGEWNQMIMEALQKAEARAGRLLTHSEILTLVAKRMKDYQIPMNFAPGRRR